MLAALNPEQTAAATHPIGGGPLLLVAGAGSGKTLTLAARVAWLLQQGADPQRLMLLSFSRRAASELERRAARLLQQALGLPAHVAAPRLPWCGTFHSVAARLLREQAGALGLAAGFTVLDRADAEELLSSVRSRLGLACPAEGASRFPLAGTCAAILSRAINTRCAPEDVLAQAYPWCAAHAGALLQLFDAYAQAKREQQALDYDDLLLVWRHLLRQPPQTAALRARWDHVLVDEMQDLNALQHELVLGLKPDGQGLVAVGDDAQAVYGFRGASVQHFLAWPQRFQPAARLLLLQRNYRSTQPLLAASNALMAGAAQRFEKALYSTREAGLRPRLVTVDDEAAQAAGVAEAVLAERESGLALKRQAVLFRTGAHSLAVELELARRNIPFVKYGGLRFTEAAHVKDLLALLRWADNPAALLSARRVARLVPGLGPASLQRLLDLLAQGQPLQAFTPPAAARAPWAALQALLLQLREAPPAWPAELQAALDWYRPHCERLHADARVRLGELQQLARLAATQPGRSRFITEIALEPPAATGDEAGPPRLDEDWLVLSTIHSAKGQEWSAVHVLNVVDGCLPADLSTGRAEDIEEERRLLYVAMTRARDSLTLWVPLRFHVTQQPAWGSRHLYAPVSRFITPALAACCEAISWPSARQETAPESAPPGVPPSASDPPQVQGLDLQAALRRPWT